jgi:Family of unknown function (DUF5694)
MQDNSKGAIMKIIRRYVVACLGFFAATAFAAIAPEVAPIKVVVLGAYHFGNPGMDVNNIKVDDVTTDKRQAELVDVANHLAKFKPTKIAVERMGENADYSLIAYQKFTPAQLKTDSNEATQIGYRLASQLKHDKVFGIDEQSETVDYFPYDKIQNYVKANGLEKQMAEFGSSNADESKRVELAQQTQSIRQILLGMNSKFSAAYSVSNFYYPILAFGNKDVQPGAELNAAWYLRNAKIFAKLTQVAKPGDRILIVFGAGHGYWLRHFVQNTPGYELVEATSLLK